MEYEIDSTGLSDPDRLLNVRSVLSSARAGTDQRYRPRRPHAVEQHALFIPEEAEDCE